MFHSDGSILVTSIFNDWNMVRPRRFFLLNIFFTPRFMLLTVCSDFAEKINLSLRRFNMVFSLKQAKVWLYLCMKLGLLYVSTLLTLYLWYNPLRANHYFCRSSLCCTGIAPLHDANSHSWSTHICYLSGRSATIRNVNRTTYLARGALFGLTMNIYI